MYLRPSDLDNSQASLSHTCEAMTIPDDWALPLFVLELDRS